MAAQSRCDRCAPLGAGEIANTGRDERLSPAWGRMQRLGLDSRVDLGICPQCGALFEWSDHPQFFGSGNLDEEHLRRLDEPESGLVRALLRAGEDPEAAQAAITPALAGGVPDDLLIELLRRLVYQQRSGFRRLLPSVLAHLHHTRYTGYGDVLGCYMFSSHQRSREIVALIEADPRPRPPAITYLLDACRKQLAAAE
ncbi:MAG: hypothetical protein JNL89_20635 [Rhodanobacteraceae bacterium]|nr:hypothetical protein [Rhodanobacteraceae bacterium]